MEVRGVVGQKARLRAGLPDQREGQFVFVGPEVVEDNDAATPELRHEDYPYICLEDLDVGRSFDGYTRGGAVQTHQGDRCAGVPVAASSMADQTLAIGNSLTQARQVCLRRKLVEEYKLGRVQPALASPLTAPHLGDVRPVLFGRMEHLFYVSPSRAGTRWIAPVVQFSSSHCLVSISVGSGSFPINSFIRCRGRAPASP